MSSAKLREFSRKAVFGIDQLLANGSLHLGLEMPKLIIPVFHGLFPSVTAATCGDFDPQQRVTIQEFRDFVAYFRALGYAFVRPADILSGLDPHDRYILLTFDDGYFNNTRALPILQEFGIPATFFVSVAHVKQGKAFWWDALYRELRRRGKSPSEITLAGQSYKKFRNKEIEEDLRIKFGRNALNPISDEDRPMTIGELKVFAADPHVCIGNHTEDHAILPNYPIQEIRQQIEDGQAGIEEITGKLPAIIAYPNGSCCSAAIEAARGAGLQLGVTVAPGKNQVSPERKDLMLLNRCLFWGGSSVVAQCNRLRSDVSIYRLLSRYSHVQLGSSY